MVRPERMMLRSTGRLLIALGTTTSQDLASQRGGLAGNTTGIITTNHQVFLIASHLLLLMMH